MTKMKVEEKIPGRRGRGTQHSPILFDSNNRFQINWVNLQPELEFFRKLSFCRKQVNYLGGLDIKKRLLFITVNHFLQNFHWRVP